MSRYIFITLLSFIFFPTAGVTDPIKDNNMLPYKAGWYSNYVRKRFLSCPATCKRRAKAVAEYEISASARSKRTFVCKVQRAIRTPNVARKPIPRSLYGNQFDNKVACYTANILGKVNRSKNFYCLCVGRTNGGSGCPDLIVTSIARPVWDSANNRSIIKATIRNIGTATAGPNLARVIDPSTNQPPPSGAPYNAIANTPTLAPGASVTVTFYLPYWVFNPDAHLNVTADYKNVIKECKENNNLRTYKVLG